METHAYVGEPGGRFKNTYELLNLRALKFTPVDDFYIFRCMGKILCVEFQRYPLKFHTKYLTHTLNDMICMHYRTFLDLRAPTRFCNVPGGRFKNTYELLNLRALKISKLHKNHIFQSMGKIFCVEFQRVPLKFHTKYLTHTLKDVDFIHIWKFKSSLI